MDLAGLREALHREPFEPFAIRLADGRSIRVNHPDFVAVGTRRAVVIQEDESLVWARAVARRINRLGRCQTKARWQRFDEEAAELTT